jgi:hypothetical protein
MKRNYLFHALLLTVVGIVFWMIADTISQPGVGDLSSRFEELGSYRNENNTGPVHRVYLVFTPDLNWEDMESYGNFMPHTKYGVTRVFFVNERLSPPLDLDIREPYLAASAQRACIGRYEKSPMGEVSFRKYPFDK